MMPSDGRSLSNVVLSMVAAVQRSIKSGAKSKGHTHTHHDIPGWRTCLWSRNFTPYDPSSAVVSQWFPTHSFRILSLTLLAAAIHTKKHTKHVADMWCLLRFLACVAAASDANARACEKSALGTTE